MSIVLLDFDDTLNDLAGGISAALGRRGIYRPPGTWPTPAIHEHVGMTLDAFMDMIIKDHLLETAPAAPGSHELVAAIRQAGHLPLVLTARGLHRDAANISFDWFRKEGMLIEDAIIVPYGQSKAEAVRRFAGEVIGYLDDHPGHVEALAGFVPHGRCLLLAKPWNASSHLDHVQTLEQAAGILLQPLPARLPTVQRAT